MSVMLGKSATTAPCASKIRQTAGCSSAISQKPLSKVSIKNCTKTKKNNNTCKASNSDYNSDIYEIKQAIDALSHKLDETVEPEDPEDDAAVAAKQNDLSNAGFSCDDSGCVLLGPGDEEPSVPEPSIVAKTLDLDDALIGEDYVLGMMGETEGSNFCAVVGGRDWNVSLTHAELRDFIQAMQSVRETIVKIVAVEGCAVSGDSDHLPPIRIKYNTKTVKMEAVCNRTHSCKDQFSLSFSIGVGGLRLVRGSWSANVVQDVLQALDAQVEGFAFDPAVVAAAQTA